jgi:hypothetical protein
LKCRKKLAEKASTYTNNEMYLLRILRAAILSVPCCLCPQCILLIEGGVKILILELVLELKILPLSLSLRGRKNYKSRTRVPEKPVRIMKHT